MLTTMKMGLRWRKTVDTLTSQKNPTWTSKVPPRRDYVHRMCLTVNEQQLNNSLTTIKQQLMKTANW